jgi:hypothetical protein
MGRTATTAQQARTRARQRLVQFERERLERQKRIEDAVTAYYIAAEKRAAARELVEEAESDMRTTLREIAGEGADIDQVASLCNLTPAEVRQLTRQRNNRQHRMERPYEQAAE